MLKKLMTFGIVAGMITIGAASASSLGTFDDVTLAESVITLDGCTIAQEDMTFGVGQWLENENPAPKHYYASTIELRNIPEACWGESLDYRILGETDLTPGVGEVTLAKGFDILVPSTGTMSIDITDTKVEDIQHVTLLVHEPKF